LRAGGKPLTVLPGMVGTAEIRTGRRSVLSFILRPMMKAQEAFTER
jgi:adhesin transport system membrane fusion protein